MRGRELLWLSHKELSTSVLGWEQWRWKRARLWENRVFPTSGPGAMTSSREDQKWWGVEEDTRIGFG